jgi:hypothetical protein
MTIYCSVGGTALEALHDPAAEACIMSEFLRNTFIGSMPLIPTNRLFKRPSGLIFECRGIARAVPIKIDKIDFDILLGYPLERLHLEDSSEGNLCKKLRKSASTTTSSSLENPKMKPLSEQNPLEKVMCVSPFVSPEPILLKA